MCNKERRGGHQGGVLSYKPVEPFILHSQINQLNHLYSTVRKTSRTSYTPQTEKPVEPFILFCHTKSFTNNTCKQSLLKLNDYSLNYEK